jgi:hypothetical protein
VPGKRPIFALRAGAGARAPTTFVGGGPLRATLVEQAAGSSVRLLPFTHDLWPLYA